jgi:hypothetical protein
VYLLLHLPQGGDFIRQFVDVLVGSFFLVYFILAEAVVGEQDLHLVVLLQPVIYDYL